MSKEKAIEWISQKQARLIEVSDQIWKYAEVGLQEFKSAALIVDELEKAGFAVERGVAGMPSAFVATWGSKKPVIGIMGEYDALPGLSQKALPYNEPLEEGKAGHGCAHNIIGTSAMGAAIAVKTAMQASKIEGTIKFFGCPAEETLIGKVYMVRDGLFEGVDAALEHHPLDTNFVTDGSNLAMNSVKFTFHGVAAHAAANPERGKSALDAVELMNTGVNFLREHLIQEARVHYVITNGGGEPNVVPPRAQSWYYLRAPKRDQVESIYNRILNIAKGADLMAETTHDVQFLVGCHDILSNVALNDLTFENMKGLGVPEYTAKEQEFAKQLGESISREMRKASLSKFKLPDWEERINAALDRGIYRLPASHVFAGSTDVGDVSWVTPCAHFFTAGFILGTPPHSWQAVATSGMSIGHKSLIYGAKVLAATAMDLLTQPESLKRVREEFSEATRGFTYKSPLPPDLKPPLDQLPKH